VPFLARRYAEPVDVERRDDAPVAFTRHGRRYAVRAVLAHWFETPAWWETADPADPADSAFGVSVADDEREMWRLEATTRGGGVAVVELCFSWVRGGWVLTAVHD
jgi:hypothetical protein